MNHPHSVVQKAILSGRLVREPCSRCGAPKAQAHHEDYSKPLDVAWLCRKCHKQRHRELKRQPDGYVPFPHPERQKVVTAINLDPDVKHALVRLAEIDGRSLSALIAKIASDWVKAHQPAKEQRRG